MTDAIGLLVALVGAVYVFVFARRVLRRILMGRWQTPRSANWRRNSFEAWKRQEFGDAKGYLETALEIAESFGPKDLRLALTLIDLAYLYRSTGNEIDQIEAANFFKRAGGIFEQLWPSLPWRPPIRELRAISAMAALYRDQYDADDGSREYRPDVVESLEDAASRRKAHDIGSSGDRIQFYSRAAAVRERALGLEHPLVAASLEKYSDSIFIKPGPEKNEALERAQEILTKAHGADHVNLAPILIKRGDYTRALEIVEYWSGPEDLKLVAVLNKLAKNRERDGDFKRAESLFQRALRICEDHLGPDHLDVAWQLTYLANVYRNEGSYDQAEPLLIRAVALREKALGPLHPDVARSLENLAWLYDAAARFGDAEAHLKRALNIYESAANKLDTEEGGNDFGGGIVDTLEELAGVLIGDNRAVEAKPLLDRALNIRKNVDAEDDPIVAQEILDRIWQWRCSTEEEERLLKKAIAVRELELGPQHWRVGETLQRYARFLHDHSRWKEALKAEYRAEAAQAKPA